MTIDRKILFIDDEQNVLFGFKRQFHGRFDILTAGSGQEALEVMQRDGRVAVAVCDMRMPGMSGLETLNAIKKRWPETVRMMLTGNADQQTAVDAINSGCIFRFFNKPCDAATLAEGIDAGIEQHQLIKAEKELVEHTLAGSIKLLSDILTLSDPEETARVSAMRRWAPKLLRHLPTHNAWEIDFAIMLAPIGRIALPPELIAKEHAGQILTPSESLFLAMVPKTGRDLIGNIPRMRAVAEMVYYQAKNFDGSGFPADGKQGEEIPLGGRILRLLTAIAGATGGLEPTDTVFKEIDKKPGVFDPTIFALAREHLVVSGEESESAVSGVSKSLPISMLRPGHRLLSPIAYKDGGLILAKATILSAAHVERLRSLSQVHSITEPIAVAIDG